MKPHVLCIGGEDHGLRIPFLLALRDLDFRITAIGSGDHRPFVQAGIDFLPFRFDRFLSPRSDYRAIRRLSHIFSDAAPDIIQSFDTKPNLLAPLAARGLKHASVVRTINGLGWLYSSRSPLAATLRPLYRALQRAASRRTTATVFQNSDDQIYFERNRMIGGGECALIAGSGVDVIGFDRARAAGSSAAALRASLNLGDAKIVMTITRLTRQKGIRTLLAAAAALHRIRPDIRFVLVGPRDSEGWFAITAAELDRHKPYVMALGKRTDIPSLLGIADVFAFPSTYREGVPRVLLEASLAELPIVTTDMPGCRDVISEGCNGLLVPPRDPPALAAAILRLLDDHAGARVLGVNAARLARRAFNLEDIVDRYAELYRKLLERRLYPGAAPDDLSSPRLAAVS